MSTDAQLMIDYSFWDVWSQEAELSEGSSSFVD